MKRNWTIALLIALAVAGAMLIGCPSESEEGKTIEGNIVLKGGKLQYTFTTPKIEHGKTYDLTLTIEDCDDALLNSHFGGKICYKMDMNDEEEDDKVLSGWRNGTPDTVTGPRKYTWTFKAGEKYQDSKDPVVDATTPAGATQYFDLMAQTSDWKPWGDNVNFNILGSITVELQAEVDWVSAGAITLGNVDGTVGKGQLSADDVARILALPNGKIVLSVSATVSDNPAPGWGVGAIGPEWDGQDPKNITISIPGDAQLGQCDFDFEVKISSLIENLGGSQVIIVNAWSGASITKAELFRPGP
jgi:hypothetical protein